MASSVGCQNDDDEDEDAVVTTDDDDSSDDDDDFSDDDDDATGNVASIQIEPASEAIPVGTEADFVATVTFIDDTTEINPAGLFWETDLSKATIDGATVTGISGGTTTLTATMEGVSDSIDIFIGPDVFLYDMLSGTLDAIDRGAETYIQDYLGSKAPISIVPNNIIYYDSKLYITDSADSSPGKTGNEKVVVIDPAQKVVDDIMLDLDSPWATAIYDGFLWVTGNLSDNLAKVDLATKAIDYINLPAGCVPGNLAGANGKIYISCTGFDLNYFTYWNKVAVYDPNAKTVAEIILSNSENPGSVISSADESSVYVIAVGNYYDTFGAINKIDTATDTIEFGVDIGNWPGNAVITDAGILFVLDGKYMYAYDTGTDSFIHDGSDPIVVGTDTSWLAGLAFSADSSEVYISNQDYTDGNTIEVFDSVSFASLISYDLSASGAIPGLLTTW